MADSMADGSRRFTLKGGPLNGLRVRLYPDNPKEVKAGKQPVFDLDWHTACGTKAHYIHRQPSAKTLEFDQEYI